MAIRTVGLDVWQLDAQGDRIPTEAGLAGLALDDPARHEYLYLKVGRFVTTSTGGLFQLTDIAGNLIAAATLQAGDMAEVNLDCGTYDGIIVAALPAGGKVLLEA